MLRFNFFVRSDLVSLFGKFPVGAFGEFLFNSNKVFQGNNASNSFLVFPDQIRLGFNADGAVLPMCNGIMTVNRDYTGETPCGMKFTTLAGVIGGGQVTPGFVGHSKYNVCQRKFIKGDGGLKRVGPDGRDRGLYPLSVRGGHSPL